MARNQYIFIDYENVNESDLSRVRDKSIRVLIILGFTQDGTLTIGENSKITDKTA